MSLERDIRAYLNGRGTSRLTRSIPGMDPNSFQPDDRTQWHHLHYAQRYSALIKYYNLSNKPDGTWAEFYSSDLSIFIAGICCTRLSHFQERKEEMLALFEMDEMRCKLELVKLVDQLGGLLMHWYIHMPDEEEGHDHVAFKPYLLSYYKARLAPLLSELVIQLSALRRQQEEYTGANAGDMKEVINLEEFEQRLMAVNAVFDSGEGVRNEGMVAGALLSHVKPLQVLSHIFATFYSTAQHIHLIAPTFLAKSNNNPHHEPHIALYITFLEAMGVVRDSINTLTRRHLEFYYQDVLRLHPLPAVPDRVYLRWQLAPGIRGVLIPAGTATVAGADSGGREILYTTTGPLYATQASLAAVRTLYNAGRPGLHARPLYSAAVADSKDGMGKPFSPGPSSWPTFGRDQMLQSPSERTQQPAQVGFAVADPVLAMRGGTRSVTFRFHLAEDSHTQLLRYVYHQPSLSTDEKLSQKFMRLFEAPFLITYTGPEGWVDITHANLYPVDYKGPVAGASGKAELILGCRMSAEYPAVVPASADLHGSEFSEGTPIFRFVIRHDTHAFAYNPLSELLVRSITVETDVQDFKDLVAAGDQSAYDITKPFAPFGVTPARGAAFYIGSREVFSKKLTHLKLKVDWFGMPQDEEGLQGYYRDYSETEPDMAFDNHAYKVKVSFLSGGRWLPEPLQRSEVRLFSSEGRAKPLESSSTFDDLDISFLSADLQLLGSDKPLAMGPLTRSGFLRLELSSPPQAFGHGLHQKVLNRIMSDNTDALLSKMKRFKLRKPEDSKPLPPLPFNPTVHTLSMDYCAESLIYLDEDKQMEDGKAFYHLHPFGVSPAKPHTGMPHPGIVASYRRQGYLFLGLRDQEPNNMITFHFQMVEGSGNPEEQPGTIAWSYWAGNEWRSFRREDLLSDSTQGMLRSGILSLHLPEDALAGCTHLGDNDEQKLHWIRGVVDSGAETFAQTQSIGTQAVEAVFQKESSSEHQPGLGIAAETITRLRHGLAGVAGVTQPFPSFGGLAAETFMEFATRVSERLRHKGRALSNYDYQHLVLQRFPQIFKVKCLPHSTHSKWLDPGNVILVVIPHVSHDTGHLRKEPRASNGLLQDIHSYLASVASPLVKITVRYPSYEFVAVRARLVLRPDVDPGASLRQIDTDLIRFLSPWSDDDGKDIPIGGMVFRSAIHEFLTRHPLVSEVERLRLYHILRGGADYEEGDLRQVFEIPQHQDEVQASQPWAVLTSVKRHTLALSTGSVQRDRGIASSTIGHDFQVGEMDVESLSRTGINHMIILSEESVQRITRTPNHDLNCLIIKKEERI